MFLADDKYFNDPEFRQMLKTYEEGVEKGTPPFLDADDLTDIADYYRMTNQPAMARATVDRALELFPHATLPNVFMARSTLMNDEPEKAEHYVSMIEDQNDPDCICMRAEILLYDFMPEEAEELLSDYYDGLEDDDTGWFIKDVVNLCLDHDEADMAYDWLKKYHDKKDDDYQELRGRTFFGLGKFKECEKLFGKLTDRNPFEKKYWKLLADSQLALDKPEAALASSEYAIAIDPDDPTALNLKAYSLMRLQNWEQAAHFYKLAIRRLPTACAPYISLATCLVGLRKFEETMYWLEEALVETDDFLDYAGSIYYHMALCHGALGGVEEAKIMLDKAEENLFDKVDIYVARGHILQIDKDYKAADRFFAKALELAASSIEVLVRIATSMTECKRYKECLALLKDRLPVMDEECKDGLSLMALCCLHLRQKEDFLHYLRLAADRNPTELREMLGSYFPENMAAKDYYTYAYQNIHKKDRQ